MWVKSYSKIYQGVKKEDIWLLWADVKNWPKWDKELEYCKIEDAFEKGKQFILKPMGGPKIKITLSEVVPNKKFTNYCHFFGAKMLFYHELHETSDGIQITYTITVTGLFNFIWVKLVAKNLVNSLPQHMDSLVNLAKANHD